MFYLDHNATSCLRPQSRLAMEAALAVEGNASSVHRWGRAARALVEDAREAVATLVSARPENVVFTSSGTEANTLALWGAVLGCAKTGAPVERLLVSAIEHDSVLSTAKHIAERMPDVCFATLPVSSEGTMDVDALRSFLAGGGRTLVAVMAANNETGVVQPIAEIVECVHAAGGLSVVDAVQSCGKNATDFVGADYLTVSAHKLGGPQGVGALVMQDNAPFAPVIRGGGQESNRRAGTENVTGIAGFGAAAKFCAADDIGRLSELRDRFEAGLRQRFADAVIFGERAPRLPNTSCFALPGIAAETALIALDLGGVMVSSGAACSSGKVRPSHVLQAMGVPTELARSALRISLGWNSRAADVEAALASLEKLAARVMRRAA
ncbi:MAG TPA: cysteine desulfurase family protein [Rhizomicrobium sp.]|jgi:cysteine desulfurase|nr:cysteine desulfurase family protein [Rhizomicrobium sp.]